MVSFNVNNIQWTSSFLLIELLSFPCSGKSKKQNYWSFINLIPDVIWKNKNKREIAHRKMTLGQKTYKIKYNLLLKEQRQSNKLKQRIKFKPIFIWPSVTEGLVLIIRGLGN